MTIGILISACQIGFVFGFTAFCAMCGFLAVPMALSAIGWTLVVLVMSGNALTHSTRRDQ